MENCCSGITHVGFGFVEICLWRGLGGITIYHTVTKQYHGWGGLARGAGTYQMGLKKLIE